MPDKNIISLAEVKQHNKSNDMWLVIDNKIYDITEFRNEHPGGEEPLDESAGKDATTDFIDVGHSLEAREMMKKFQIGILPEHERLKDSQKRNRPSFCGIALGGVIICIMTIFFIRRIMHKN